MDENAQVPDEFPPNHIPVCASARLQRISFVFVDALYKSTFTYLLTVLEQHDTV